MQCTDADMVLSAWLVFVTAGACILGPVHSSSNLCLVHCVSQLPDVLKAVYVLRRLRVVFISIYEMIALKQREAYVLWDMTGTVVRL